ncbi:hypothetical protein PHMEG_00031608 [Phytophthora megakarya]|uniref:Uncharacterized protein n=1 Tax=Phytophthora megakarya TaxID=4795 RepID=A0A225V049_9STRA|nr:hypothetical protein PHMEG_00031608 [Phytophthora megakarya]
MADVIVVDDINAAIQECEAIAECVRQFCGREGVSGKIYTVSFAYRGEDHAAMLNNRTWRPLSTDAIRQLYYEFIAMDTASLSNAAFIDSDI